MCAVCPHCANVKREHACRERLHALDALLVSGFYHDPFLRLPLTSLKYHGATCLLNVLGEHLKTWGQGHVDPWPWAGISEIGIQHLPAMPSRVRARGFDQAALIANLVHTRILPWGRRVEVLKRHEGSTPQAKLDPTELRRANVHGVFEISKNMTDLPRTILLVDDVLTTGSTMDEAARILKVYGVERIFGFAVALGK